MAEARRALAALLLLSSPALAQPVVGGLVARPPQTVNDQAQSLFRLGAAEIGRAPKAAPDEAAQRKFDAGKQSFLDFQTKAAERSLTEAVDLYLKQPDALPDSGPAVRAVLLLAQVQLARRRTRAAEATIERALVELPGFPGKEAPAPDVAQLIERVRSSMKPRARPLRVTSTPPGLVIRVNGMVEGPAPVSLTVYAPIVVVTAQDGDREVGRKRVELRRAGTDVTFTVGAKPEAEALLAAVEARDADRAWPAAKALGDRVCLGLIDEGGVLVARLDSGQRAIAGAHATSRPSNLEGWRALGRYCAQKAPSNIAPPAAQDRLFLRAPVVEEPPPSDSRNTWGWVATGAGAAALGTGVYLGLEAASAADRFNESGRSSDEDAARSNALGADVAYVVGGALIVTGLYLLLTD